MVDLCYLCTVWAVREQPPAQLHQFLRDNSSMFVERQSLFSLQDRLGFLHVERTGTETAFERGIEPGEPIESMYSSPTFLSLLETDSF